MTPIGGQNRLVINRPICLGNDTKTRDLNYRGPGFKHDRSMLDLFLTTVNAGGFGGTAVYSKAKARKTLKEFTRELLGLVHLHSQDFRSFSRRRQK